MAVFIALVVIAMVVGAFALAVKLKKTWPLVTLLVLMIVYMFVQPSYLPKGEVKRSVVPAFESSEKQISDKSLKPKSGQQYDEERNQAVKQGLPFK